MAYEVAQGTETHHYERRDEAIAAAKELSAESGVPVFVIDPSGREQMTYQRGELESYTWETRTPRRRDDAERAPSTEAPPTPAEGHA